MAEILQVRNSPVFDSSITKIEEVTINPNNPLALRSNDSVGFAFNLSDSLIHLRDSYFVISGVFETVATETATAEVPKTTTLVNGFPHHLFSKYELRLNNSTVETVVEPALTIIPKIYSTCSEGDARQLQVMGWGGAEPITSQDGVFHAIIPFKVMFGIGFDFDQVLINTRVDIILTRSSSDIEATVSQGTTPEKTKITLHKIQYKLPVVTVDDVHRLEFLKLVEKDEALPITFRTWELHRFPQLPKSNKQSWTIKTASQLEKPRIGFLFFQTDRAGNVKKNSSEFDHCELRTVELKLNNESYPGGNLDQSFSDNNYLIFYNMLCNIRSKFGDDSAPILSFKDFKNKAPLFVIDCSRQKETLKHGTVDVRLEFEATSPFPDKTTAYFITVHDTVFEYQPLTSVIRKIEG